MGLACALPMSCGPLLGRPDRAPASARFVRIVFGVRALCMGVVCACEAHSVAIVPSSAHMFGAGCTTWRSVVRAIKEEGMRRCPCTAVAHWNVGARCAVLEEEARVGGYFLGAHGDRAHMLHVPRTGARG